MTEIDTWWLQSRPSETLIADRVVLERFRPVHSLALAEAVNASHEHLRPWMAWAQSEMAQSDADSVLREAAARFDAGTDFGFLILSRDDEVVGACGLHPRRGPGALEIGYWVHVSHTGRGYAAAATQRLVEEAFDLPEVERVEIRCDEANLVSAAVPRRVGFKLTRVEDREPRTPAETSREMVWVLKREDFDGARLPPAPMPNTA